MKLPWKGSLAVVLGLFAAIPLTSIYSGINRAHWAQVAAGRHTTVGLIEVTAYVVITLLAAVVIRIALAILGTRKRKPAPQVAVRPARRRARAGR